jgi:hypothetical protein
MVAGSVIRVSRTAPAPRLRAHDAIDPSGRFQFQDRLAKLTEHGAHADMIVGAVAQHGLRVATVAQWLQPQTVRVLKPVDRPLDAGEQRRLVRGSPCSRASSLLAHRATLRDLACGHPLDISYSIRNLAILYGQRSQPDAIMRRCSDATSLTMKRAMAVATTGHETDPHEAGRVP